MEIILSLIVYVIFVSIFLFGLKKDESQSREECYKRLNGMRGIMALEIVIGHVVRYETSYLIPFGKFMLIGVGFFFFVSGWGLCKSFHEKKGYLDTFLRARFGYLTGTAFVALGVTSLIAIISPISTNYSSFSWEIKTIIQNIFVRTNWYVRELLLLYLVFYLVYKYAKKKQLMILTGCVIVIAGGLYKLGYVRCWYASILAFPAGFLCYEYYSNIMCFLTSMKGKVFTIVCGIVGLSSVLIKEEQFFLTFIANNALCVCVVALLVMFFRVYYLENPVKNFLNKYATELFLFQFVLLAIAEKAAWNYWYRMFFVVGMDILVSMLVHPILIRLKRNCNKICKGRTE